MTTPEAMPNSLNVLFFVRPDFQELPGDQRQALADWLVGRSFAEVAEGAGLPSAKEAERLVRAALQRLRRQFREEGQA